MRITLLVVGKIRGPLEPAIHEFEERARRYWRLEMVEVDAGLKGGDKRGAEEVRAAEAERIRERLPPDQEVWGVTRRGKGISSKALAEELGSRALHGMGSVTFLVGGAYGLDDTLLRESHRRISLSPMTLPHEMARLLLVEQLYRAGTLLRNEPYHKGGMR